MSLSLLKRNKSQNRPTTACSGLATLAAEAGRWAFPQRPLEKVAGRGKKMLNKLNLVMLTGILTTCFTTNAEIIRGPITNPDNKHTYYLLDAKTWNESEAEAITLNGHLATIRNSSENQWVYSTFFYLNGSPIDLWIGLNKKVNQTWIWSSGDNSTYRKWTETSDVTGIHNCAHFWKNSNDGWWNQTCDSMIAYGVVEVSNQSPTITSFTATPKAGNPPLTVSFAVIANDLDGSISAYQWDFIGDGRLDDTTTTGKTSHTYNDLGKFKANVTVVDNQGAKTKSSSIPITVQYGPDLIGVVDSYSFKNETNTIHIEFKVTNAGDIPARQFPVTFNLSNNGTKVLSTFKNLTVDLAARESKTLKVDYTFDASIYGQYILILVDPTKNAAEVDETNNGTRIVVQPMATK